MVAFEIKQVLERVNLLSTMSELDPSEFAEENGLADSLAQKFKKDELKPTQLRKIFHALKQIERGIKIENPEDKLDRTQIMKLLPELAYASGRGLIPKDFYDLMKTCLSSQKLKTNSDFMRLMDFLTAILAYHKMRRSKQ